MALAAGIRLGAYEVLAPLGAGGMGEVYRARDTRLGREVALKVLPDRFARDPDRLARFEREARLLAPLNHPHVATIHGLEEAAGVLRERLADTRARPDARRHRARHLVLHESRAGPRENQCLALEGDLIRTDALVALDHGLILPQRARKERALALSASADAGLSAANMALHVTVAGAAS